MFKSYHFQVVLVCLLMLAIFLTPVQSSAQIHQIDINIGGPVTGRGYADPHYSIGQDRVGNVVVIWSDHRHAEYEFEGGDELSTAIYGRIHDAGLTPKGSDFRISEPIVPSGSAWLPDLLVLENGHFIVVWQERKVVDVTETGNRITERRIVMTIKDIEGNTVIPETTVNDNSESTPLVSPHTVHLLPGNQFIISWADGREGEMLRYGQLYDVSGSKIGTNFRLTPEGITTSQIKIREVDETTYLLSHGGINTPTGQWMRYYDADHQPIGDWVQLEQPGVIYPFSSDSLLVLFWDRSDAEFVHQYYQFLSPDGTTRSAPVLINDPQTEGMKTEFHVARNPADGSFMIVWRDARNGWPYAVSDIYAQHFDTEGQKIGTNFKVNHEPREKTQTHPLVLYTGDDEYLIAWWETRRIICSQPGVYIGNARDAFLAARKVKVAASYPGPIWGWENYMENYLTVCEDPEIPPSFSWKPNFPNPFNTSTTLVFDVNINVTMLISIEIYDPLGRLTHEVYSKETGYGEHHVHFDATGLSSGVYYARLSSPDEPGLSQITKLLVVK